MIGGVGWFLLRRYVPGRSDVDDTIWTGDGTLGVRRSAGTAVLSEIVVGLGASIGREAGPRLMGGVCGSLLGAVVRSDGGATADVGGLRRRCWLRGGLQRAARRGAAHRRGAARHRATAGGAAGAGLLVGRGAHGLGVPAGRTDLCHYPCLPLPGRRAGVGVAGRPAGRSAGGRVRPLDRWVSHHRARRWWVLVAPLCACARLGGLGLVFPQLYGNGKDMAGRPSSATARCRCSRRCSCSSRWSRRCVWAAACPVVCSPRR